MRQSATSWLRVRRFVVSMCQLDSTSKKLVVIHCVWQLILLKVLETIWKSSVLFSAHLIKPGVSCRTENFCSISLRCIKRKIYSLQSRQRLVKLLALVPYHNIRHLDIVGEFMLINAISSMTFILTFGGSCIGPARPFKHTRKSDLVKLSILW